MVEIQKSGISITNKRKRNRKDEPLQDFVLVMEPKAPYLAQCTAHGGGGAPINNEFDLIQYTLIYTVHCSYKAVSTY